MEPWMFKDIIVDLDPIIEEKGGGGASPSILVDAAKDENVNSYSPKDMSVCDENNTTAPIQPVVSSVSTSANILEVVASPPPIQTAVNPVGLHVETATTNETKSSEPQPGNKTITKLVLTNSTGKTSVLQSVVNVNSPLITVLNSSGPLTVVKCVCVTSVVSSAPHYTLVNSAASINPTNAAGKPPTITVLNRGPLTSPLKGVKNVNTQQGTEKLSLDIHPIASSNVQTSPGSIENRGQNVLIKNTHSDSSISDTIQQAPKLPTVTSLSPSNVLTNTATIGKPNTANGQKNKVKIFSNIQIANEGAAQTNFQSNKPPNVPLPRYNIASRQKLVSVDDASHKYSKPSNVLKPIVTPTIKSPQDKPARLLQPPIHRGIIKSIPGSQSFIQKPQQHGIKILSPLQRSVANFHSNIAPSTIPAQRTQKVQTRPNYIGKHAVQALKLKHLPGKLKAPLRPAPSMFGNYHMPPIQPEKQLTFNQALTAQIIETLSNSSSSSSPPVSNKYEVSPARYDSAFNCPDKQVAGTPKTEAEAVGPTLSPLYLCKVVLLDHNYYASLPSSLPDPDLDTQDTQAQANGIPPSSFYNTSPPNKRRFIMPPTSALPTASISTVTTSHPTISFPEDVSQSNDDDNFSDVSDMSDGKRDTEDGEEGEETDTAPESEDVKNDEHYGDYVTRCICRFVHDDGYMVECDKCKVWQHVQCVVKNRQIPDEYLCELCDPSKPVDRQKARSLQEQWIRERQPVETKIRKEAKLKENLRQKESSDSSDSSDDERMVRNNNIIAKNRTAPRVRRRSESSKVNKKEGKEPVQRRQKRKEKKIIKRKFKFPKPTQFASDDETPETWTAHLPQLRQWIEKYEEAVTNHYSPELRARISSIRVNGATAADSTITYEENVFNCRIHTQPLTEIKYLVSTVQLEPSTPVIELRGKYMLSTQHRNAGGSLTTRQHSQRPGPFLFFYRLQKDNTEVCVDTRTYGNSARFIRRSCKPNAELQHCIDKGVLHLYIVTIAPVPKNCELTLKHESHDLASIGTTQIACACGRPDECTVNETSIKNNGESPEVPKKKRGRRANASNIPAPLPTDKVTFVAEVLEEIDLYQFKEEVKTEVKEDIKAEEKVEGDVESKENVKESCDEIELPECKVEIKEELLEPPEDMKPEADVKIKAEPQEELSEVEEEKQRSPSPLPPPKPPLQNKAEGKKEKENIEGKKEKEKEKRETKKEKEKVEGRKEKDKREKEKIEAKKEKEKTELKKEKQKMEHKREKEKRPKEEKVKKPSSTQVSTRRTSHHKPEKEESKEPEKKQTLPKSKKLSREERKLEAILKAIEQMEKADQKKQEHQAKQAHRRESEPGPGKDEEKPEKVIRRRRRGRARTTSTNAQTRRTRLNSSESYMTSGDENLLSPNEAASPVKPPKDENSDGKVAGLLLAISSNGDSDNKKDIKSSPAGDHSSSSSSAHSSPETPQLSSACLLVQAAVEPLESGFKFPKTKKGLMNEWLNKTPDPVQLASTMSPVSLVPQSQQQGEETCVTNKNSSAPAASSGEPHPQQHGGNAKKRWLRQAISEDQTHDDASGMCRPESPTICDAVAPPKKRKLPRESLSNSPPTTPTRTGSTKCVDTPRICQEGSVEIVSGIEEDDSPSHMMESDAELKERADKMKLEFGNTMTLVTPETPPPVTSPPVASNTFSGILSDPRLCGGAPKFLEKKHPGLFGGCSKFSEGEHLVGPVRKTLTRLGIESSKPHISLPVKRKRKKVTPTDKSDDQDDKNDSPSPEKYENNSCDSFKNETKTRSRSSSTSSISSTDEVLKPDAMTRAPVFNSEPTELERQRETCSFRLKKVFGFNIDEESRKQPVIDMASIIKCDSDPKPKSAFSHTIASILESSMSPKSKAPAEAARRVASPPILTSSVMALMLKKCDEEIAERLKERNKQLSQANEREEEKMDVDMPTKELFKRETVIAGMNEDIVTNKRDGEKGEEQNVFYTPDEYEDREAMACGKLENPNFVPPFTSPVCRSTSAIDKHDDSRYQSRNPSPPPNLEATTFENS
ncbi:unnamed protein product [Ceutorhynchus assimilis]|uniref:SET domain-containing protein n=1 Tax=Ceutorhynchus assimilis TaxID=467358 RepID=A0A9N9Q984_9CUCU|nr:unnamed protein product [Ceutorhynchus assimilis]